MINKIFNYFYKDDLHRNSIFLILNNIVTTGLGFFFWMIIARLFSTSEVGYATTIISAIGLVASFSFLGLNVSLIRYLPRSHEKSRLIGSCINLTALVSIVASIIFLILIPLVSPKLMFVLDSFNFMFAFVLASLFWVLFSIVNSIFIASRKSNIVLIKSTVFGLIKLIFPVLLVSFGVFGILGSYYLAALIGFLFSLFYFKYKLVIDFSLIKKMFKFSFGNYIASIFGMMPMLVLPIMIIHLIGPESTAYFYVSWMIAGLLFFVPGAVGQSLLTEGSYDNNGLDKKVKKAYKFTFLLLIPGILILIFFGKYLLLLFGKDYSLEGFRLLQILAISSIFYGINQIRIMKFNVLHRIDKVILIQFIVAFITLVGSYFFGANIFLIGIIVGIGSIFGGLIR